MQKHDETTAEKIVQTGLRLWKMPDGKELQENARKGDTRKVAMAILIKRHTSASNIWIAERLGMGHDRSVSRSIKQGKDNEIISQRCKELEKCYNARTDPNGTRLSIFGVAFLVRYGLEDAAVFGE